MTELGEQGKGLRKQKIGFWAIFAVITVIGFAGYLLPGILRHHQEAQPHSIQLPMARSHPLQVEIPSWDKIIQGKEFKRLFRLKRTTDLLGLHLFYLESRQVPQQVVIAENVPKNSSDIVFSANPDLALMTMISNQMLALRKKKNAQQLAIDKIETLSTTPIKLNDEYFKQRQVKVTIRFSNEKKPRYYLASLLKYPIPQRAVDVNKPVQPLESVMVTFAKPESYQETLLPTLLGLNPAFSKKNAKLDPDNPSAQKKPANH